MRRASQCLRAVARLKAAFVSFPTSYCAKSSVLRILRCNDCSVSRDALLPGPYFAQMRALEGARQGLHSGLCCGAIAHCVCKMRAMIAAVLFCASFHAMQPLAPGCSPSTIWSARVRWKGHNRTLTAVHAMLPQCNPSLFTKHRCTLARLNTVATSTLGCNGRFPGGIWRARACWTRRNEAFPAVCAGLLRCIHQQSNRATLAACRGLLLKVWL